MNTTPTSKAIRPSISIKIDPNIPPIRLNSIPTITLKEPAKNQSTCCLGTP